MDEVMPTKAHHLEAECAHLDVAPAVLLGVGERLVERTAVDLDDEPGGEVDEVDAPFAVCAEVALPDWWLEVVRRAHREEQVLEVALGRRPSVIGALVEQLSHDLAPGA